MKFDREEILLGLLEALSADDKKNFYFLLQKLLGEAASRGQANSVSVFWELFAALEAELRKRGQEIFDTMLRVLEDASISDFKDLSAYLSELFCNAMLACFNAANQELDRYRPTFPQVRRQDSIVDLRPIFEKYTHEISLFCSNLEAKQSRWLVANRTENAPIQAELPETTPAKKVRAWCPNCQGEREVLVLMTDTKKQSVYFEPDEEATFYDKATALKCAGCEFIFLQKESWNSEAYDEFGFPCTLTECFPKWGKKPIPDWITDLAESSSDASLIFQKLREVLLSFESNWYWLACVGCRSVLEAAMIEKVGDQGTFKNNLEAYHREGKISGSDKDQLAVIIEVGHGATHRSFHPTREQVKTAIDIVCRVLQGVYVHAPQAQNLGQGIPPRQRRQQA
jgi:hypothetical protein